MPGGSFSQLATVNAPIAYVDSGGSSAARPAINFGGRDLIVVSEGSHGHTVTLTTCVAVSCSGTTKVSQVTAVDHPIIGLGIGVPAGNMRILWTTRDTDILGADHYSGHVWIGSKAYP